MTLVERYRSALPLTERIMGWIAEVVEHGARRPGTVAGHRTEAWCLDRLRDLGVQDVRREQFDVPAWAPGEARLLAWPDDRPDEALELQGFQLPHTRSTDGQGHEAPLVLLDLGTTNPLAPEAPATEGVIAVDPIELGRLTGDYMATRATSRVDPSGELDDYVHLLPFSFRMGHEADTAMAAGAFGYVGLLTDMPWATRDYYLPYDAVQRDLPAVWINRNDGGRLQALMAQGPVRGRIETGGRRYDSHSANVIGTLPGESDEWIVIGSHHDAPWASAVEDGSGIALVLAQAQFWAKVPAENRPHNLMFLLNGGHMAGAIGIDAFRDRHRDMLDKVVLAIHLEHAATTCEVVDEELVATEDPEVRWWFTSQDAALEQAVGSALTVEKLDRSWLLPPDAFGECPPTDGGRLHLDGVPLVDFLTAPVYLVDACDTLDKVHQPSLEPLTRATVRIIESLRGRSAADLRARGLPEP